MSLSLPLMATLIDLEPAITWLLVSTRPSDVRTMPVPAAAPLSSVVLMLTTDGMTESATLCASSPPLPFELDEPWLGTNALDVLSDGDDEPWSLPSVYPRKADTESRNATARATKVRGRPCRCGRVRGASAA